MTLILDFIPVSMIRFLKDVLLSNLMLVLEIVFVVVHAMKWANIQPALLNMLRCQWVELLLLLPFKEDGLILTVIMKVKVSDPRQNLLMVVQKKHLSRVDSVGKSLAKKVVMREVCMYKTLSPRMTFQLPKEWLTARTH